MSAYLFCSYPILHNGVTEPTYERYHDFLNTVKTINIYSIKKYVRRIQLLLFYAIIKDQNDREPLGIKMKESHFLGNRIILFREEKENRTSST